MEKKFKPFERIIYKEKLFNGCRWHCAFFSDFNESNGCVNFADGNHYHFSKIDILPYEGNEHLVGTDLPADEEVRLEEGEWVMYAFGGLVSIFPLDYKLGKFIKINEGDNTITIQDSDAVRGSSKFIKFSNFNPNDMEETKKHILCVKNGKIVRYKG